METPECNVGRTLAASPQRGRTQGVLQHSPVTTLEAPGKETYTGYSQRQFMKPAHAKL